MDLHLVVGHLILRNNIERRIDFVAAGKLRPAANYLKSTPLKSERAPHDIDVAAYIDISLSRL